MSRLSITLVPQYLLQLQVRYGAVCHRLCTRSVFRLGSSMASIQILLLHTCLLLFTYMILVKLPLSRPAARNLERPRFTRTSRTLSPTSTSDITYLLCRASFSTAVLSHGTALRLQQVIRLNQRLIRQHRVCYVIPKSRVEGRRLRPCTVDVVCGPRVVFEFPDGSGPGEGFGDVGDVGLDVHYLECLGVYFVELVSGVVACQGGDGGTDEAHC